ncbi:hypothetical protein DCAR_0624717 [Daucus carota subsp. sativus]|uniref:BHLH domain-containing protein n=1 Tax=Daucus carota subsp. sativus TaxID=79200 RepID=A0A164W0D1_DAUCS|nr:PREDICTED: transcription factor ILI3 [Daucus carota subsp. sativus]WOH05302.1 hypothetical protein DCAR_0624717 [Daucus carota subsp. sativus]
MSSSRTATDIANAELDGLASKLLALATLLPHSSTNCATRVPALDILKETCSYINSLQTEVNDLSDKLSQLLASADNNVLEVLKDFLQL